MPLLYALKITATLLVITSVGARFIPRANPLNQVPSLYSSLQFPTCPLPPLERFVLSPPRTSAHHQRRQKKNKLVYAVGGQTYEELPDICRPQRSSRAFVCDFGSKSLAWEELPPMSRPKLIHMGVVSPSDGKLYVFGNAAKEIPIPPHIFCFRTNTQIKNIPRGDVFDPSSSSWTRFPAPPKYDISFSEIDDYTFDMEENKIVVFTEEECLHTFDLTTLEWSIEDDFGPLHPTCESDSPVSSSVVVGDTIYKYHIGELYAMDKTSDSPSFERVPGLAKKLDSDMSDPECIYKGYLSYLGKGKFTLVWGGTHFGVGVPEDALYITCIKFWVGVCDRTNRCRALIDRREEYIAQGY